MKKELHHLEIHPADNGGHAVEHHYRPVANKGRDGFFRETPEPERHMFGKGEPEEMLAHVANHLNLPEPKEREEEEEEEGEEE